MSKRILILDDDDAILEVMEASLEYANFTVKIIDESKDVFSEIEEFQPDLILLDYILQGINGGEICHQIKTSPRTTGIPVILMSAFPRVLLSLGDYGCDAFIAKPFDLADLIQQVNICLLQDALGVK